MLAAFTLLNLLVFRAEITRIRRLSRARIESEIQKMKEAARSYRLGHSLGVGSDTALTPPRDANVLRARVKAVLDQLGKGLARVGLAKSQPANQLERIVGPQLAAQFAGRAGSGFLLSPNGHSFKLRSCQAGSDPRL